MIWLLHNKIQIKNRFPKVYKSIIEYNLDFDGIIDTFSQQKYNYVHKIKKRPICKQCGKKIRYQNFKFGYKRFCSNKCSGIYKKSLSSEKKEKIKLKRQNTCIEKYGCDNVAKSDIVKKKALKTCNDKYGYNSPLQNSEINAKRQKTFLKNWAGHPLANEVLIKKRIKKRKKTMTNKWIIGLKEKFTNIKFFNTEQRSITFVCQKCHKEYTIHHHNLYMRSKFNFETCLHCNPLYNNVTQGHMEIIEFLINECNIKKEKLIVNDRSIIGPKELDILIPDLKIAFEYNGVYWHNSLCKPKNYHIDKFFETEQKNIKLIQIWQDDWIYKKDIIKSRIKNLIQNKLRRIYARKCEIKNVNTNISKKFLIDNHLQSYTPSKIKYGLFYNNELVSIMTFGKLRKCNGMKSKENTYELYRFCNKINHIVIGGASKMFKHFIKNYHPNIILSYSNNDWGKSNLYSNLDFDFNSYTTPGYYYIVNGIKSHRYNWTKYKLVQNYKTTWTEKEIMAELGHYQIWNSGNIKWIWNA